MDESGAESMEELHFFYDAQSRPAFVEYNGVKYRYVHNLQGDIVGIVDSADNLVVEYRYDAWGKPLSITGTLKTSLGELNPFGYRGYVWDEETKLYYLRSRYYNPERNRFNSVDSIAGKVGSLGTHNLFMYCANNPMLMSDPDGRFAVEAAAVGGTYGGPVGAIIGFFIAIFVIDELKKNSPSISWSKANVESVNTTQFDKAKAERYRSKLESAVFYIAYGSNFGGNLIYDENNPLNFQQTLIALGVTAAVNANSNIYTSGFFQIDSNHYTNDVYGVIGRYYINNADWGVYTKNQMAAEGLAYMLGCTNPVSEITKGTSGYEHYHDPNHIIHIWYRDVKEAVFSHPFYEERELLLNMEESSPEHDDIRIGIYLLLDDQERAERYYQKLGEKTKTAFMQYPIYKFWKHSDAAHASRRFYLKRVARYRLTWNQTEGRIDYSS